MLLHVERDRTGRRRLSEIAMLRRTGTDRVQAVVVWQAERGVTGDSADRAAFGRLLGRGMRP